MARLATSTSHEKNTKKKKRASRRRPKPKTKTRVGVFTNHTGVCPRTGRHVVDMLHACASVGRARGVHTRARFQGRETSRARANRRGIGSRTGAAWWTRTNAQQTNGARACDRSRGRRLRGVRRAGRGHAVLRTSPACTTCSSRCGSTTEESESAKASARRETTRRERNAKRTRTRTEEPPAFGSSFWIAPTAGRFGHGGRRRSSRVFGSFVSRRRAYGTATSGSSLLFNSTSFVGADPDNPSTRARRGRSARGAAQTMAPGDGVGGRVCVGRRRPTCRTPPRSRTPGLVCWRPRTFARAGARPRRSSS